MRPSLRTIVALSILLPAACFAGPPTDARLEQRVRAEYAVWHKTFPEVGSVEPTEAWRQLQSEAPPVLVDVRTEEEQAVSGIPGAITRQAFEAAPDTWQGRALITYCTIGARSGTWAASIQRDGWEVANITGGLLGWAHAGLPLQTPEGQPTTTAHVHSRPWKLLPSGYQAVW